MEVTSFRRIGLIYAALCFLGSFYGVVFCFKFLIGREFFRGEVYYLYRIGRRLPTLGLGIQTLLLALSSAFCVLIEVGIEELEPAYIRSYRVFMLMRNTIFIAEFTYENILFIIEQLNNDHEHETLQHMHIIGALLLSAPLITGVELLIVNGVDRYVKSMISGKFHPRRSRYNFHC